MSAEQAIRQYLRYLDDPQSLRDDAEVARLDEAAAAAIDPIEKLKLLSAAQRAKEVDGSRFEEAFIANARSWAAAEGVTAEAFRAMGVPQHVLVAAGVAKGRARRASSPSGSRAAGISVETVMNSVPDGPFRIKDLVEATGASLQTVRKAVRALLDSGGLSDLGLDPNWDGRGRTPTLYAKR